MRRAVVAGVVVTGLVLALVLQHLMLSAWGDEVLSLFYSKQFHHANTVLLHVICQSLTFVLVIVIRQRSRFRWLLALIVVVSFLTLVMRVTYGRCSGGEGSISYVVISIPRNAQRLSDTMAAMDRAGIDVTVVMGVDGAEYSNMSALFRDQQLHYGGHQVAIKEAALSLSFRRALLLQTAATAEWVVLFEDDASPVSWFRQCLLSSVVNVDVVWLDTRETFVWHLFGALACCTSGIMYRRASIPKILALLEPEIAKQPFDLALASLCRRFLLQCSFLPLVIESGAVSSRES